jgi:hypothetical protein
MVYMSSIAWYDGIVTGERWQGREDKDHKIET